MKKSDTIQALSKALAAAQAEMPVVPFDSKNPFLNNRYASLGSVISVTRPVLAKHGLSISQLPISNTGFIGVETALIHESGEWISEAFFLPLGDEKGKSMAQVAGSIITYLRRYSWSSFCGIYADEDTDGNGHGTSDHKTAPKTSPVAPGRAAEPKKAPATSKSPKIATETTRKWFIEQVGKDRDAVEFYFIDAGLMLGFDNLETMPLSAVPTSLGQFRELMAKVAVKNTPAADTGVDNEGFPKDESQAPSPEEPDDVPFDDPNSPDAPWRTFRVPFGPSKDTPLAKLDKNNLYGWYKNYVVETEWKGRPCKPEKIAEGNAFRACLNDAGRHYGWDKEDAK